jgi:hypothetical protein
LFGPSSSTHKLIPRHSSMVNGLVSIMSMSKYGETSEKDSLNEPTLSIFYQENAEREAELHPRCVTYTPSLLLPDDSPAPIIYQWPRKYHHCHGYHLVLVISDESFIIINQIASHDHPCTCGSLAQVRYHPLIWKGWRKL